MLAPALAALLAGCATLPANLNRRSPRNTPPRPIVYGAHGPLSVAQSERIIKRLQAQSGATDLLHRHLAVEEALSASPLVAGNKVTLLVDGPATFKAMFDAIANAEHTVNIETYIINDDALGKRLARLLIKKRAAGVTVNLMYDGFGSRDTPAGYFDRLRAAGVHVVEYHPINPLKGGSLATLNNRDHRKLVIVDGRVAFTGGINISAVYLPPQQRTPASKDSARLWRDTDVEIRGPVVSRFQKLFLTHWQNHGGPALPAQKYLPHLHRAGSQVVRALGSRAGEPQPQIYATLLSAINSAQDSIEITNAYFAPNQAFVDALMAAARRGVQVELILPAHSDVPVVQAAGRAYYGELLRAGVKIYERRGVILHAKSVVIDGVWSTVGSSNLDWRSFLHNDEVNAVVLGRAFGRQMQAQFRRDLRHSKRITLWHWRRRSVWQRIKESFLRLWAWWF